MEQKYDDKIRYIYKRFNARDIDSIMVHLDKNVHWPNGWEGGYVHGHEEVRNYWTRQWKELDPSVEPVSFEERQDGRIEVEVHQIVKDLQGNVLFDGIVKHLYTIKDGLIRNMDIEKP